MSYRQSGRLATGKPLIDDIIKNPIPLPTSKCFKNKVGNTYDRWLVVAYAGQARDKTRRWWLCSCECGTQRIIDGSTLTNGVSKSCGCLQRELAKAKLTKHGGVGTPEYNSWAGIKDRCRTKSNKDYHNYGARGIEICNRWLVFNNFLADMGERPGPNYSIDRINNNGNYEPSNCRWATTKQQRRNTRKTWYLTIDNITKPVADWAEISGIKYSEIWRRVKKFGWDAKKAVFTELR